MAVDKFRFLSPGIQTNEIDESRVQQGAVDTGPVIIGRTAYGPAMTPVQVSTVAELNRVFGEAYNGKNSSADVWRDGNRLAPTYATYAAEAFLRNSSPVTVIRTLGFQNNNPANNAGASAGWILEKTHSTGSGSVGAYGIFVWPWDGVTGSANALTGAYPTGSLAAIVYTSGSTPYLVGITGSVATEADLTGTLVYGVTSTSNGTVKNAFKLKFSGSDSAKVIEFTQDNPNFIRKVLNTDPTKLTAALYSSENRETYFLGESFEGHINDKYSGLHLMAAVVPLDTKSADFKGSAKPSKSGWIVSNHDGVSGSFTEDANGKYLVTNLFRFVTLNGGTWEQANLKISIENIRVSPNQGVNPYPSFDVALRSVFDDSVLERYNGVNLNSDSDNYIAKVIGDSYFEWSYLEERNIQNGEYPNNSSRIRVEMSAERITPSMIPFGFYGPVVPVTASNAKTGIGAYYGSVTISSSIATLPFAPNSLPLRTSNGTKALKATRWGLDELSVNNDRDYSDFVRRLSNTAVTSDSYAYEPSGSATKYSFMFSLDNIILTGSNSNKGQYLETARSGGTSYSAKNGANSVLDYFNSFDLPLFGGSDGVDIRQKEPIVNNGILTDATEQTSYAYNTLDVAIKMIADPELFETDIIVIPGLTNTTLTDRLINLCEERADSIALIDIENDYIPAHEGTAETLPVVASAISSLKARKIDSSYAAAYYPAVYDASAGIFLPASIAALGVVGGTEGRSALWFAPAGFNRGGLNRTSSGLNVSRAAVALTSKQRDDMYVANINPIATFPREGVVVFGQKTLLATPSALDRVNVRRLLNFVKRQISRAATVVLFEPNVEATWNNFKGIVEPFLLSVKNAFGLDDFRVVLDSRTTTADLVDRNIMYAKIILKPTKSIEFIALDFVITNTGAVFTE